ncbi:MAG: mycothiol system anti-sigma-R factor [candidate division Zixibacteria bacterium]|nr:mycothiol system anti-sigma-R factor [candidate division Zixibacteria bacterium]
MDCKQALLKLYNYLDNELDAIECKEVEEHLKSCKHCFGKAEFERILKKTVQEKCCYEPIPEQLKSSILERIKRIDKCSDSNQDSSEEQNRFFFSAKPELRLDRRCFHFDYHWSFFHFHEDFSRHSRLYDSQI